MAQQPALLCYLETKDRLEMLAHRIRNDCRRFSPSAANQADQIRRNLLPSVKNSLLLIRMAISECRIYRHASNTEADAGKLLDWPFRKLRESDIDKLTISGENNPVLSLEDLCRLGLHCIAFTHHGKVDNTVSSSKWQLAERDIEALHLYAKEIPDSLGYEEAVKAAQAFYDKSQISQSRQLEMHLCDRTLPLFKWCCHHKIWHFLATGVVLSDESDYLVTARHIFEGEKESWFMVRHFGQEPGFFQAKDVWVRSGNSADVAMIPCSDIKAKCDQSDSPSISWQFANNNLSILRYCEDDSFAKSSYSMASRVVLFGSSKDAIALTTSGSTAIHPSVDYQGAKEGVLNVKPCAGHCGAPILIYNDQGSAKLLGFYSRGLPETKKALDTLPVPSFAPTTGPSDRPGMMSSFMAWFFGAPAKTKTAPFVVYTKASQVCDLANRNDGKTWAKFGDE